MIDVVPGYVNVYSSDCEVSPVFKSHYHILHPVYFTHFLGTFSST